MSYDESQPSEVADKVLRRARVSKMTRALQDRLALANIKINRGWENRSLESLEPELELEIKRKRTISNADVFSDSSSVFSSALAASSPVHTTILSDDFPPSGSSHGSIKRIKPNPNRSRRASTARGRLRNHRQKTSVASWKSAHQLPASSPTFRHSFHAVAPSSHQPSFASESSTVVESASVSEDDDQDIPLHSFEVTEPHFTSSPPRTPPQDGSRSARIHSKSFSTPKSSNHTVQGTKEGADLLMFLASSPSPAIRMDRTPGMHPPSTPPSKHTPLPSSMMSTPGGQAMLFGFNPHTPSANFNFADFVNVTPSPAQAAFNRTPGRTPGGLKTPIAARETRRRLNFEASPRIGEGTPGKRDGLGMDLGGDLRT